LQGTTSSRLLEANLLRRTSQLLWARERFHGGQVAVGPSQ